MDSVVKLREVVEAVGTTETRDVVVMIFKKEVVEMIVLIRKNVVSDGCSRNTSSEKQTVFVGRNKGDNKKKSGSK